MHPRDIRGTTSHLHGQAKWIVLRCARQ
jgi:hypothetical protein